MALSQTHVNVNRLPEVQGGLDRYFTLWWEAQRQAWQDVGRDPREEADRATSVFNILASALGPLALDELAALAWSGYVAGLQERISDLGRWIIAVNATQPAASYAFAHPRLGEYWRQHKMGATERAAADRALLDFCQRQLTQLRAGAAPSSATRYALQYFGEHLQRAGGDIDALEPLVCREWWKAHRAVIGSDDGFLRDIERAWAESTLHSLATC